VKVDGRQYAGPDNVALYFSGVFIFAYMMQKTPQLTSSGCIGNSSVSKEQGKDEYSAATMSSKLLTHYPFWNLAIGVGLHFVFKI